MLNKVILVGNVGIDPEVRTTESGVKVARIRLATTERLFDRQANEAKAAVEQGLYDIFKSDSAYYVYSASEWLEEMNKMINMVIVILTGIAGNLLAEVICKAFHITDPIAKGIGIGTSAHAVGTSKALQMGEVEGAMSGLSIAVAGVLTAVLCPFFVSFIQ